MKIIVTDKFKSILETNDAAVGDITTVTTTVTGINKKGVFIGGSEGSQVPVKVELTDGEAMLSVGDTVTFQVDSGLLVSRTSVKAVPAVGKRTGSGTPDRSFKQHGN